MKFGVILDVEVTRAIRQAEVGAAKTMIERTEERFGLKPERLVGDTAYGAAPMLNWLVEEKGIAPHIPVFDNSKRDDGTFSRSDFRYDPTSDVYHCPSGKQLGTSGTVHEGKALLYRASKLDCDVCPLKPQCCPKEPSRKIPRDIHEHARDVARSFVGTEGYETSRRERKKIEMRFAQPEAHSQTRSASTAWTTRAHDEFVLAAIAQNLRRLASLVARPPPAHALCIASRKSCVESVRVGGSSRSSLPNGRRGIRRLQRLLQQNRHRTEKSHEISPQILQRANSIFLRTLRTGTPSAAQALVWTRRPHNGGQWALNIGFENEPIRDQLEAQDREHRADARAY